MRAISVVSPSLFCLSHALTLSLCLHPLEKPERVILLVSYTRVDVIIVNQIFPPMDLEWQFSSFSAYFAIPAHGQHVAVT